MKGVLLTTLFLLGAVVTAAQAQRDTTARIIGTVRSSINGRPLAGVMIALKGARLFDVSDSTGSFALVGLPSGRQTVRILYGDSLAYEQVVKLKSGKTLTLSVLLDVNAVELAPIVVEARTLGAQQSLAGFYDRKRWNFGRFYTAEDLHRRASRSLRSLLLEAGVEVRCRFRGCLPLGESGVRACVMSLFLDGMWLPPDQVDLLSLDELAGVEVYKHALDVPVEYRYGYQASCGAVMTWSQR